MIFTVVLCLITLFLLYVIQKRPKNFPPGPRNWPLVGTLPVMIGQPGDNHPFNPLDRLRQKHGNLVGLFLGIQPAVLVSGYENVKEISAREDFTYRPDITVVQHKMFHYEKSGLFFVDGEKWKTQRRFTLRHLRDFGFGKQSMDHYIHSEIDILFAVFRDLMAKHPEQKETGHDFLKVLPAVAINTLWYIIAGEIHGLENEHFIRLTRLVLKFFRLGDQTSPVPIYRLLQHIPFINNNFKQQEKCGEEIMTFIQEAVVRHVDTFNENDMRDFMDVYIREMKKDSDGSFSENQLISICMDLFLAGTETTASTTTFTLRYLIKYPEIQEKVRNEIYQVVGKDRLPSTEDMPNLHYCMAVLTESMRHSGVTPSTPPKSTVKDVNFQGYNIPKGCMMIVNLRSVNMDEKHLGDPETFRPERFIGPDGKFRKDEKLMLFGSGTRICLGEPFAKNTTFIFYTSIVQNFKLEAAPYGPKPSEVILDGFTTAPEPFKMTMTALN
ncbi:Hypothetical predicted protein [Cloeon dipterum]|uniref:Cytochrome P450 n=1 Tax=Cloeon dipterum TaxID=197152 RepID=A0A8S1DH85_9INSE|nr:Hypothetical predicted protein [Cloeon dipterum]